MRRMNMKSLAGAGKHPRRRPLPWPQANLTQHRFPFPCELGKVSAIPLMEHFALKNLDPRYDQIPRDSCRQLPRFHPARLMQPIADGGRRIITRLERGTRDSAQAAPEVLW